MPQRLPFQGIFAPQAASLHLQIGNIPFGLEEAPALEEKFRDKKDGVIKVFIRLNG